MDFRQLRYFMEIARQGSLTKASEKLGIAQPSLGYHVRRLEEELQLPLLVRSSRGVGLTAAGRILFEEGGAIVNSLEALRHRLLEVSAVAGGAVSVGLTPSLAERLLVPLIEQVKIEHPSLKLSITEDLSKNLSGMIEADQLDLALAYDVPARAGLVLKKVESEPIGFACAASGSGPRDEVFDFKDIARYPLVLQKKPHHMREVIEQIAAEQNVELNIAFEMHSGPAVLQLVEHGLGGTVSSLSAQPKLRRDHRIVIRRFANPSITAELFLVSSAVRPVSKAQKVVAAILANLLSGANVD
jgi:LysR family nitrogen assimilation transcriptional regulator